MTKIMASDEWLRCAVQEGIDEIDQGECIEFASIDDLAEHIREIGEEVSRELAAGFRPA